MCLLRRRKQDCKLETTATNLAQDALETAACQCFAYRATVFAGNYLGKAGTNKSTWDLVVRAPLSAGRAALRTALGVTEASAMGAAGCSVGEKPPACSGGSTVLCGADGRWELWAGNPSTGSSLCPSLRLSAIQKQQEQPPPLSQLYCHRPARLPLFPQQQHSLSAPHPPATEMSRTSPTIETVWDKSERELGDTRQGGNKHPKVGMATAGAWFGELHGQAAGRPARCLPGLAV